MQTRADCYAILGLTPDAPIEEVKRCYRDLAAVWHPDRFASSPRLQQKAEEKLKEINEAYRRISQGDFPPPAPPQETEFVRHAAPAAERAPSSNWQPQVRSAPNARQRPSASLAMAAALIAGLVIAGWIALRWFPTGAAVPETATVESRSAADARTPTLSSAQGQDGAPAAAIVVPPTENRPENHTSYKTNASKQPGYPDVGNATVAAAADVWLQDGTPVRLRFGQTISSAEAEAGDPVPLEVLDEIRAGGVIAVPKGALASGTVSEVQPKGKLGHGGKIGVRLDFVRLANGQKAPLRAQKLTLGGGHKNAMTAAMAGSAVVFWPAAPLFVFVEGKDADVKKGEEITAYLNGDFALAVPRSDGTTQAAQVRITSVPDAADIELDGRFVGQTPSAIATSAGEHEIRVAKTGWQTWRRQMRLSPGTTPLHAALTK